MTLRMCPRVPLTARRARAALLQTGTPAAISQLIPMLSRHPDLQGLAKLAAHSPPATVAARIPLPGQTVAAPMSPRILAQVAHAHRLMWDPNVANADRTRAAAFLTEVYLQALQQLGLNPPLAPFTRLLAGRMLHHGRVFCTRYWQHRVAGLESSFVAAEVALYEVLRKLESSPTTGEGARLGQERLRTRRYLLRDGPRARISARRGERVELLPLANELQRLVDQGLVDTAFERGLVAAAASDGPGLDPMESLLRETLATRGLTSFDGLLDRRLAEFRGRDPPPPDVGPGSLKHPVDPSWPSDRELAAALETTLEASLSRRDHRPSVSSARLVLTLFGRPQATLALLARAGQDDAPAGLRAQRTTLHALTEAQLDHGHARLTALARDDGPGTDPDADILRSFSVAGARPAPRP